jgi:PqqD family protein of HPr-rel-A system
MAGREWRLDPKAELHWRPFDGEWVVFDTASGDTHKLDAIAAAILMCLESGQQDSDQLEQVIAAELSLPVGAELRQRIDELLEQFGALGLIEPARS